MIDAMSTSPSPRRATTRSTVAALTAAALVAAVTVSVAPTASALTATNPPNRKANKKATSATTAPASVAPVATTAAPRGRRKVSIPATRVPGQLATAPTTAQLDRRAMAIDFDFMTPAEAADRISEHPIVSAAQLTDESGRPVDEAITFAEQRGSEVFAWVLTSSKATGAASYGGYRVLLKQRITNQSWMWGSGRNAPLMGNATDAFTALTSEQWVNATFRTAPVPAVVSPAPALATQLGSASMIQTATKKAGGTPNAARTTFNERLISTGSTVIVTRIARSAPEAVAEIRGQAYDGRKRPIGRQVVRQPAAGPVTPYSDPVQVQQKCQTQAALTGTLAASTTSVVAGELLLAATAAATIAMVSGVAARPQA